MATRCRPIKCGNQAIKLNLLSHFTLLDKRKLLQNLELKNEKYNDEYYQQ